jgi:hypothetical protein
LFRKIVPQEAKTLRDNAVTTETRLIDRLEEIDNRRSNWSNENGEF